MWDVHYLFNQNFRAEVRKFLDVEWIARSERSRSIPLAKRISRLDLVKYVESLLLVLISTVISMILCELLHSNLTSITGCLEQTVPRYLPCDFKHHVRSLRRTLQIFLSGNKSTLRAINSQNIHFACEATKGLL